MEVKITPKSCSKLLLWLQSQVKETKLFRDGQTKAGDEGEMDPAYGKSYCLLALLTVPITFTQLNESCFLQRCSACSVSFGLQCVPTHSQRTDTQTTSLEALLKESVSQWDLVIRSPRLAPLHFTWCCKAVSVKTSPACGMSREGLAVSTISVVNIKAKYNNPAKASRQLCFA